jgi:hypothetical protein
MRVKLIAIFALESRAYNSNTELIVYIM